MLSLSVHPPLYVIFAVRETASPDIPPSTSAPDVEDCARHTARRFARIIAPAISVTEGLFWSRGAVELTQVWAHRPRHRYPRSALCRYSSASGADRGQVPSYGGPVHLQRRGNVEGDSATSRGFSHRRGISRESRRRSLTHARRTRALQGKDDDELREQSCMQRAAILNIAGAYRQSLWRMHSSALKERQARINVSPYTGR